MHGDTAIAPPIFIVAHARTGSTMLRYVLDAHPDVCCPAEIEIGKLCQTLYKATEFTVGEIRHWSTEDERRRAVRGLVRGHVGEVMGAYCRAKNKRRWCDKSISNADSMEMLSRIFPDASFICLHRQCLDVVRSCLDVSRFGFRGPIADFVARSPSNLVEALIESWMTCTERLLAFEEAHPLRCFRLRYEDFVARPAAESCRLFEFLSLSFDPAVLEAAFVEPHDGGPGDAKVRFTSHVHAHSVGKGARVPVHYIADATRARMDCILERLGYAPSLSAPGAPGTNQVPDAGADGRRFHTVDEVFAVHLPAQIVRQRNHLQRIGGSSRIEVVEGRGRRSWRLDPASGPPAFVADDWREADCTLIVSSENLIRLVNGESNVADAYMGMELSILGRRDLAVGFARLLAAD